MPGTARRIRKVLVVQPPAFSNNQRSDMTPNMPLGIGYIAAVLEQEGYQVQVLDCLIEGWHQETRLTPEKIRVGLAPGEIEEAIAAAAPDVVGVSSMFTSQRKNAHLVADIVKRVCPRAFVVFGGAHPTAAPDMVLSDPHVDYVVLGEGDNAVVPLLRALEAGKDVSALDGIGFRSGNGHVVKPKTQNITDLDALPLPARHLMPMEKYFAAGVRHGGYSRRDRAMSMITSRGCPYLCNFCTAFKVFTRTPRIRSVDNIMAEVDELVLKYRINEIFFEDDQFLAKVKHTEALLDVLIDRGYDLVWDTPNGVSAWLLNERIIAKMGRAGCYRVNLAIESGNQYVLDHIIRKPVKLAAVPETVRLIRKYGMDVGTFLVVGNIGTDAVETKDQIRDSFRLVRRLNVWPHVSYLTPYPGSDVLRIAEEKGYLVPGFNWDDLVINKQSLSTPEWTAEELERVVEREKVKTRLALLARVPELILTETLPSAVRDPVGFVCRAMQSTRRLVSP